jgi:hypothetical protein
MMVYVVMAFDAEPYEPGQWIHGVYDSKEKAEEVIRDTLYKVFDADEDGWGGYMLSQTIEEIKVQ